MRADPATSHEREIGPLRAWYAVVLMMIAYTLSMLDRTILSLLVEPLQQDLGISDLQFGALQGLAFAVFYCLAGLPIGWLVDRASRRAIIGVGIGLWSAATVASGFATSYAQLFIARSCVGVGEATLNPAAYSMIADMFSREKIGKAVGVFTIGAMAGTGIAYLFGGTLVAALADRPSVDVPLLGSMRLWQVAFLIAGLPGIFFALLMFTIREPARTPRPTNAIGTDKEFLPFLRQKRSVLFLILGGYSFFSINSYGTLTWAPAMLLRDGVAPGSVGLIMGIGAGVFGIAGNFAGGWLTDFWTKRGHADSPMRVGVLGTALTLPLALGAALGENIAFKAACIFGLFFTLTAPGPATLAGLQLITPSRLRGRISALYTVVVSLVGIGLGPLVVGFFTDRIFQDRLDVGKSLAAVALIAVPMATIAMALARRPFRDAMAAEHPNLKPGTL